MTEEFRSLILFTKNLLSPRIVVNFSRTDMEIGNNMDERYIDDDTYIGATKACQYEDYSKEANDFKQKWGEIVLKEMQKEFGNFRTDFYFWISCNCQNPEPIKSNVKYYCMECNVLLDDFDYQMHNADHSFKKVFIKEVNK